MIALTAGLMALPILAVVGSNAMWWILPFPAVALWGLWIAIQKSYRSGATHETLVLTPDLLTVTRCDPGRRDKVWRTNPYWVRLRLWHEGPVTDYLTLTDGRREIELGGFLSPGERVALRGEIDRALAAIH